MNDKLTVNEQSKKLEELLDEFGIKKLRKASAVSLSGGDCLRGICHWRKVNQTFPETRPEMAG
jgi:ABC-type lipopolysaccharide export system ATPase subunit